MWVLAPECSFRLPEASEFAHPKPNLGRRKAEIGFNHPERAYVGFDENVFDPANVASFNRTLLSGFGVYIFQPIESFVNCYGFSCEFGGSNRRTDLVSGTAAFSLTLVILAQAITIRHSATIRLPAKCRYYFLSKKSGSPCCSRARPSTKRIGKAMFFSASPSRSWHQIRSE